MNYYAITALLARVYMWEKEYKKAYDMAMEVIEAKIDDSKFFGFVEHTSLKEDMKDSESIFVYSFSCYIGRRISSLYRYK